MQTHFPKEIIDAAQASQATWHIPASITLAQFLVESGAGVHMPGGLRCLGGVDNFLGEMRLHVCLLSNMQPCRIRLW